MKIRRYKFDDFESIKDWITDERTHAMWCANRISFPLQIEGFHRFLDDILSKNGDYPFVAVDDSGAVEGFFCYSLNRGTNEGMLKFVMVDPLKRGLGLGKEMIRLAVRYAFDNTDADAVRLMVFSENKRAMRCYESVGFTIRHIDNAVFRYNDEAWSRCNMIIDRDNYADKFRFL